MTSYDTYISVKKRFPFTSRGLPVKLQLVAQSSPPPEDRVEHLIVVCHGHDRDALEIFKQTHTACPSSETSTLILAPHFYNGLDKGEYSKEQDGLKHLLVWKGNNWGEGGPSQYPSGANVSSFEALDAVLLHYADKGRCPRLMRITMAGHSMGGQFVQRYAMLSGARLDVPLSYVVINASTYLYPETSYSYKYGLAGIASALSDYSPALVPRSELLHRINSRTVHYLVGASDNGVGDTREEAMKQGATRRERFHAWRGYLLDRSSADSSTFEEVHNATHDAGQMIGSPEGTRRIFWRPS